MDAITNNFSLVEPTVGGDVATWGGILNSAVIAALDAVLGNVTALAVTSADVSLTTSQMQTNAFAMTGTLTGNRNVIIPLSPNSGSVACGGKWVFVNGCSGAYSVTVETAASGSTGVVIPQGFAVEIYSDGTNVNYTINGVGGFALASNGNPNGALAGTAGSVNTNASVAFDYANNIIYVCTTTGTSSTAVWTQPQVVVARGFDTAANLGLTVTHTGGNLLSLAITQASGSNATAGSPIIVPFQTLSSANTTGLPTDVSITGALSMTTNATGATLGVPNNVPFRIWFALFNNAGTVVPAMRVCSLPNGTVSGIAEYGVASTTAISGSATSDGVWYTPNGTTLTNCAFRVVGYCEYLPGNLLTTSGTYTAAPSNVVLFGPGIQLPGTVVRTVYPDLSSVTQVSINSGSPVTTNVTGAITPTSAVNLVKYSMSTDSETGALNTSGITYQMYRSSTAIGVLYHVGLNPNSPNGYGATLSAFGIDNPATTSSTSYTLKAALITGSATPAIPYAAPGTAAMILEEIMG